MNGWKNQPYWKRDNSTMIAREKGIINIMARAKEVGSEIDKLGERYRKKYDGTLTPLNYKSQDSIRRKVVTELGGNLDELKDSVRNTVVVPFSELDKVIKQLKADEAKGIFSRVKVQDGPSYFGYKGVITNVKLSNGLVGEMQVNSPGMIYAKVPKHEALFVMDEKTYDHIAKTTGLPGGRGHELYEDIRKINPLTASNAELQRLEKLIKESEDYYSKFYGF
jgi:hypothetical protein